MTHFITATLREEYDNDTYRAFMRALEGLEGEDVTRAETLLDALPSEEWSGEKVIKCMRELANDFDLGRFLRNQIEWDIPPRVIARAVLSEDDELSPMLFARDRRQISGHQKDIGIYAGKYTWTHRELLALAAYISGVDHDSIVVNLKIGEAKEILARSQAISVHEVSINLG